MSALPSSEPPDPTGVRQDEAVAEIDSRLERLRRGLGRIRGTDTPEEENELELTVLLLREENARLKAERHRPADVGTAIDRLRQTAVGQGPDDESDQAWSLLSRCLVIQEELAQTCEEIKAAMNAVQDRLEQLKETILGDASPISPPASEPASITTNGSHPAVG